MSSSFSIAVHLQTNGKTFRDVLRALVASGWVLDNGAGGIQFVLMDSEGEPEVDTVPLDRVDEVLAKFDAASTRGEAFAVDLSRPSERCEFQFWFDFKATGQGRLDVTAFRRNSLRKHSALEYVTDHHWYLERIIPPVISAGCTCLFTECADEILRGPD